MIMSTFFISGGKIFSLFSPFLFVETAIREATCFPASSQESPIHPGSRACRSGQISHMELYHCRLGTSSLRFWLSNDVAASKGALGQPPTTMDLGASFRRGWCGGGFILDMELRPPTQPSPCRALGGPLWSLGGCKAVWNGSGRAWRKHQQLLEGSRSMLGVQKMDGRSASLLWCRRVMAADPELDSGFATRPQQICHKGDGFSMGKPHPRQINLKNRREAPLTWVRRFFISCSSGSCSSSKKDTKAACDIQGPDSTFVSRFRVLCVWVWTQLCSWYSFECVTVYTSLIRIWISLKYEWNTHWSL